MEYSVTPTERFKPEGFIQFDWESGKAVSTFGQRIGLFPAIAISGMQKAMEAKAGAKTPLILYEAGVAWGESLSRRFYPVILKDLDVTSIIDVDIADFMNCIGGFLAGLGWGKITFEPVGGSLILNLHNSTYAEMIGTSQWPVCDLFSGFFAAVFSEASEKRLGAVEIQCSAQGQKPCRFLIGDLEITDQARKLIDDGMKADDIIKQLLVK